MTRKQQRILRVLSDAKTAGTLVTITELQAILDDSTSKQAMQCSLRLLEKKLLLERSYDLLDGRIRLVLLITEKGFVLGRDLSL